MKVSSQANLNKGIVDGEPTYTLSSSTVMPMPVSLMTSLPTPPSSEESGSAEMVTLNSPVATTDLSLRVVSRSFSSASLALERSSRRKTSLLSYRLLTTMLRRRETSDC